MVWMLVIFKCSNPILMKTQIYYRNSAAPISRSNSSPPSDSIILFVSCWCKFITTVFLFEIWIL